MLKYVSNAKVVTKKRLSKNDKRLGKGKRYRGQGRV